MSVTTCAITSNGGAEADLRVADNALSRGRSPPRSIVPFSRGRELSPVEFRPPGYGRSAIAATPSAGRARFALQSMSHPRLHGDA